jgi:hypothetical protein
VKSEAIAFDRVVDKKRIIGKMEGPEEEERHKGSLTKKRKELKPALVLPEGWVRRARRWG